jgi:hypothetical protein
MKRKFVLAAVISLFVLAISAAAQDKATNFSGAWELDVSKSKLGERAMIESQTLTVTQTDKDITIQTATKRTPPPADAAPNGRGGGRMGGGFGGGDNTLTFTLDGKETKTEVEGRMGKMPVTQKAKWDGAKLQLSTSRSFNGPDGEMTMTTKDKWELSSDGKTLTINSERSGMRGNESSTKVYSKKQ